MRQRPLRLTFSLNRRKKSKVNFKSGIPSNTLIKMRKLGVPTLFQYCNRCRTEQVHYRSKLGVECYVCHKITLFTTS